MLALLEGSWPDPLGAAEAERYRRELWPFDDHACAVAVAVLASEGRTERPPPAEIAGRARTAGSPESTTPASAPIAPASIPPASTAPASDPESSAPGERRRWPLPLVGLTIGVAASGLGLVLPWITGLLTVNGYDTDDGKIVLVVFVIGVLGLIAAVRAPSRGLAIGMAALGLVPLAIGLYDGINIERAIGENDLADALFSTGAGVWVTAVSGAIWSASASFLAVAASRSNAEGDPT